MHLMVKDAWNVYDELFQSSYVLENLYTLEEMNNLVDFVPLSKKKARLKIIRVSYIYTF
jgi:hypothetical protein